MHEDEFPVLVRYFVGLRRGAKARERERERETERQRERERERETGQCHRAVVSFVSYDVSLSVRQKRETCCF